MGENLLQGQSVFAWEEIDTLLTIDANSDGNLSREELEQSRELLEEFGEMLYALTQEGNPIARPATTVTVSDDGQLIFDLQFDLPMRSNQEAFELEFAAATDFPLHHRHAFHVTDASGKVIINDVSDRSDYRPLFLESAPEIQAQATGQVASEPGYELTNNTRDKRMNLTGLWIALACLAGALMNGGFNRIRRSSYQK
ncbi:MAG: hypothetical protein ACI9R3_004311 [Verrucomicrobiales bacterium]|jgi:hypothetical protein